jgi:hypothetical protein
VRDGSASYPGNATTGMPQLVLYLRAGYYVHYYHPGAVGSYGSTLRTALRAGLDAFFAGPRSRDVTDANGETLAEAVTLIDSAEENARYLHVLKRLLSGYDSSWNAHRWMLVAVNNVYTVTFRGHQVPAFVSAVQADPSLIDSLYGFATRHLALLGTDRSYLTSNAGRELGRFLLQGAPAGGRPAGQELDHGGDRAALGRRGRDDGPLRQGPLLLLRHLRPAVPAGPGGAAGDPRLQPRHHRQGPADDVERTVRHLRQPARPGRLLPRHRP